MNASTKGAWALALSAALGAAAPAAAQSVLNQFSYDNLRPSGIQVDLGSLNASKLESSLIAGVRLDYGLIAPKALPSGIAIRIREAAVAAVNTPDMKQMFLQQGALPITSTGAEYQALMRAESDKWKAIIGKAKISLE